MEPKILTILIAVALAMVAVKFSCIAKRPDLRGKKIIMLVVGAVLLLGLVTLITLSTIGSLGGQG